jgi:hypothetical protein
MVFSARDQVQAEEIAKTVTGRVLSWTRQDVTTEGPDKIEDADIGAMGTPEAIAIAEAREFDNPAPVEGPVEVRQA